MYAHGHTDSSRHVQCHRYVDSKITKFHPTHACTLCPHIEHIGEGGRVVGGVEGEGRGDDRMVSGLYMYFWPGSTCIEMGGKHCTATNESGIRCSY